MIKNKLIDTILENMDIIKEIYQEYEGRPEGRRRSADVILLQSHGSGEPVDYLAIIESVHHYLDEGIKTLPVSLYMILKKKFIDDCTLEEISYSLHYRNTQLVFNRVTKIRNHFRGYFEKAQLEVWEWTWLMEQIFKKQENKKPRY